MRRQAISLLIVVILLSMGVAALANATSGPAEKIRGELTKLVSRGEAMQAYRGDNINLLRTCGQKMRTNQARIESLRNEVQALPLVIQRMWLGTAIFHADICCSCSDNALKDCKAARKELAHPEEYGIQ